MRIVEMVWVMDVEDFAGVSMVEKKRENVNSDGSKYSKKS